MKNRLLGAAALLLLTACQSTGNDDKRTGGELNPTTVTPGSSAMGQPGAQGTAQGASAADRANPGRGAAGDGENRGSTAAQGNADRGGAAGAGVQDAGTQDAAGSGLRGSSPGNEVPGAGRP